MGWGHDQQTDDHCYAALGSTKRFMLTCTCYVFNVQLYISVLMSSLQPQSMHVVDTVDKILLHEADLHVHSVFKVLARARHPSPP